MARQKMAAFEEKRIMQQQGGEKNGLEQPEYQRDPQESRNITRQQEPSLDPEEKEFFAAGLRLLNETGVQYVVGAAFARHAYTGIWRKTKDLDVFIKPQDLRQVLDAFKAAGYTTTIDEHHWLAKVHKGEHFIDLIFGTGHGQLRVDENWFKKRQPGNILGVQSWLIPFEEMMASAMFIGLRNRFDAADVVHLIRVRQGHIDWERILELLGEHWELLLWQLILFDYVYPGHDGYLPKELMVELFNRVQARWETNEEPPNAFRGMILDPFSFTVDFEDWGYEDRRDLTPIVDAGGNLIV